MTVSGQPPAPDAERVARSMRGVYAAILALEAFTLLLVPRTVARVDGLSGLGLTLTLSLAVLLVVLSAMQRRSWGFAAGCLGQVAFLATGVLTSAMFVLGIVFGGIWIATWRARRDLLARAGGAGHSG